MTVVDFSLLWKETLSEAEKIINRPSFETWLKATKPLSLYENTMVVEVPNEFTKEWLETRYQKLLNDLLKKISDTDYTICFVCNSSPDSIKKFFVEDTGIGINVNAIPPKTQENSNQKILSKLNPKYTFETFVVGSCNRLAHAASLAVSEAPSRAYNPLFIYGGVGLGKTHLMQAIGHFVYEKYINLRVLYLSSEKFTNDFINSIRDNKTVEFRNKYRNIDVLLIDDIQFLAGKEQTQEEFFHTFNALHESNKQIVISSDRPPKEIPTLEDRLRSRFEWGLITDIQPPDLETRIAILKKKTFSEKVHLPDTVLNYIGNKIETNIRELEGALIRIIAYSSLNNLPIDIKIADEALKDIIVEKKKNFTVKEIIIATSRYFGISPQDIEAKKRSKNIAFPRQVAMYLSRELTDFALMKIGDEFGGKDHSTVIHGHRKIAEIISKDQEIKEIINKIIKILETY